MSSRPNMSSPVGAGIVVTVIEYASADRESRAALPKAGLFQSIASGVMR